MTPAMLEAFRRLLFFSQAEAAEHIAHARPRAWQYWELGARKIPANVAACILALIAWRADEIARLRAEIAAFDAGRDHFRLVWHHTPETWAEAGGDPVLFRPTQSVAAQICAEFPDVVRLVIWDDED